jgi:hypothetical protein
VGEEEEEEDLMDREGDTGDPKYGEGEGERGRLLVREEEVGNGER